ncbi:MAG: motility protein A [Spirochaetales bacterium]|nr:motility protein A [Spirochaetales bacterium]
MDLGTIIGLVAGLVLVVFGIFDSGAPFSTFINFASVLITVGGSFGAVVIATPLSKLKNVGKYFGKAFKTQKFDERKIIQTLVSFSEKARREGILALEDDLDALDDEFLKKGIQMAVDGTDPEIIKDMLYNEIDQLQERHGYAFSFFADFGFLAPAFGMIGTLIGLIGMLAGLEGSSEGVGAGMSIALITTLYGALLANLVLIPMGKKLENNDKAEMLVKQVVIEGILSIQQGDNPRMLEMKLLAFLPPKDRTPLTTE